MTADAKELTRRRQAIYGCKENRPAIAPNQVWIAKKVNGVVLRRIRILAKHPDMDTLTNYPMWIYQELPARMYPRGGHLGTCPEFNLRYVFELERS